MVAQRLLGRTRSTCSWLHWAGGGALGRRGPSRRGICRGKLEVVVFPLISQDLSPASLSPPLPALN